MYAVMRTYSGTAAKDLGELLEQRRSDVDEAIRQVDGLVSYSMLFTADGVASVTVCEDKAGTDQSSQIAREWILENAPDLEVGAPLIYEGEVILNL